MGGLGSLRFSSVVADPVPRVDEGLPRHHAVIAGTGRAGTSFLVRFLGRCGLDTGSPHDFFDERARAGLEHYLLDDHAPYVVKDPWLFSYCNHVDPGAIAVDALLVPVRELMAAATSRILQERIAMAEGPRAGWPPSDVNGVVTAGAVYSLDPVDEARILAVGFHRLIHWATAQQVPLFLLEFPRIVNDGRYLIESLWPWLGNHCDRVRAQSAYAAVADPYLVRVGAGHHHTNGAHNASIDSTRLDREAMAILIQEREALLASANDELAETREDLAENQARLAETESRLAETEGRLVETERFLALRDVALAEHQMRLDAVISELNAVRGTMSWRLTGPLRTAKGLLRRNEPQR